MSGAPEQDIVKATKEDSVITEAARVVGSHQGRAFDVNARNPEAPLETIKCTIQFGGLVAVNALDMSVRRGEIYGLIGPNGAGKTTVFNLLTGVYKPTSGEIYFQGKRIDGLRSYEISRRGVSRTFQNIRLFPSMSVLENVMTACHRHAKQNLVDAIIRSPRFVRDEKEHREREPEHMRQAKKNSSESKTSDTPKQSHTGTLDRRQISDDEGSDKRPDRWHRAHPTETDRAHA